MEEWKGEQSIETIQKVWVLALIFLAILVFLGTLSVLILFVSHVIYVGLNITTCTHFG